MGSGGGWGWGRGGQGVCFLFLMFPCLVIHLQCLMTHSGSCILSSGILIHSFVEVWPAQAGEISVWSAVLFYCCCWEVDYGSGENIVFAFDS